MLLKISYKSNSTSLEPNNGNTINLLLVRKTWEIFSFFTVGILKFSSNYIIPSLMKNFLFPFPNKSVILIWKSHHLLEYLQ